MISIVPDIIFWPGIIFVVVVYVARYRWCNTTPYDTYFNRALAGVLTAQLLSERHVEAVLSRSALLTVTAAQQLAYVAITFATTEMVGFTMLWARLSPEETRRRHRYYRLVAVLLCAGYLAAATRARIAGQPLEVCGGWDTVLAWSLCVTMWFVMAVRAIRLSICELNNFTYVRELFVLIMALLVHGIALAASLEMLVLAVSDQLGWTDTVDSRLRFHAGVFSYQALIVCVLAAVPLGVKLQAYFGLDSISCDWKRLQPLRLHLMAVVPESGFHLEHVDYRSQKTTLQLHHTIIEIRDAILRLRPYFREMPSRELAQFLTAHCVPPREHDVASYAFALAHAVKAKTTGATPELSGMTLIVESRAATLDEETTELLKLAKWWTPAHTTIEQFAQPHPAMKVSSPA